MQCVRLLLKNLTPAFPVFWLRHPGIFTANLLRISLVIRFACTQDGKVGIEQHLGVNVVTGIMRFRFPNKASNPMAF